MDSFELNKIIGAILGVLLFVMGTGFIAEAVYHPIEGRGPGYSLPEEVAATEGPAEAEVVPDIGTLLLTANLQQGEASVRKCLGCHTVTEAGGNKQGPELFGIVDRQIAAHAGFTYSDGLHAHDGEAWSYENLDHFLLSPRDFAPGTKMNFAGIKNHAERASLIAYLASITPGAPAFPAPAPAADATAEADAPELAPGDETPVPTEADAIETPSVTGSETAIEGTPASGDAAPEANVDAAAEETPAAEDAPAEETTTTSP